MTSHDWFIEHRTEYAARVLAPQETDAFAAHLVGCEACRAAVARIEGELEWLPMAAAPIAPRPAFEQRALANAIARRPSLWRRWALPLAAAASLVSGLVGWQLGQAGGGVPLPPAVSVPDVRVAALQDTLSIMREAARVLQARIEMPGRAGGMVIFDEPRTHRWNVLVHGLPTAPAEKAYQFWFICADGMVRGAAVRVSLEQPALFTTGMPAPSCKVVGAALTVEPMGGGASALPQGKTLAHVML